MAMKMYEKSESESTHYPPSSITSHRTPPSYEEARKHSRLKPSRTSSHGSGMSRSSNRSSLRLTGLTYAFTTQTLPSTEDDIALIDPKNGSLVLNAMDKYRPPDEKADISRLDEGRDAWGSKLEFILASIGLAVGLGNIWRFPYLLQRNGGGAFLIPYFIMMILEGIPLFYLEFVLGQRFRKSAIGVWSTIHPALKGVGISCIIISSMLCIYYVAVIAWSFYYMFVSLTSTLPWRLNDCPRYAEYSRLVESCDKNKTMCFAKKTFSDCCVHDPQLYYFYNTAIKVSSSIEDAGAGMNWHMFGCLVLSWVVVYLCIIKGVKSSGKVVYFTATFPYFILVVFFFVGVTLDGASIGLKALFYPKFERLLDSAIWMDAATQMFFTLGLGFGSFIAFASYMPMKNNCVRDTYIVVLINCGTSIFAGIVVFSILGHREYVTGQSVTSVGSGPGLAFITFCDAFLQIPASPLWAVLFFIMLILLGIDSEFGTLEAMITPFYDMKWVSMRKEIFTGLMSVAMLLVGIAIVSGPGYYVFQMFDDFSVSLPLLVIAFVQVVAVSWVYGNDRFANDVEFMTGKRPYFFWMLCWKYISPLVIFFIFVASCHKYVVESTTYKAYVGCKFQTFPISELSMGTNTSTLDTVYPGWAQFIIACFIIIPIVPIFISLGMHLYRHPRQWRDGFYKKLSNPHEYHPDPWRVDPSRRTTYDEMEKKILEEFEITENS